MINIVVIGGNLARDPELRFTPKGTAVCSLSVAVNRKWKNDSGEKMEEVSFVDCTAFGKTAETITQYFKKGKPILIQGRLKQDSWDDKQTGQKRSKLGVIIDSFHFTDANGQGGGKNATEGESAPTVPITRPTAVPEEDDVPF